MPPEVGDWVTPMASAGKESQGSIAVWTAFPWRKNRGKHFLCNARQVNPIWYNGSLRDGLPLLFWGLETALRINRQKHKHKQTNSYIYSVSLLNITSKDYFHV